MNPKTSTKWHWEIISSTLTTLSPCKRTEWKVSGRNLTWMYKLWNLNSIEKGKRLKRIIRNRGQSWIISWIRLRKTRRRKKKNSETSSYHSKRKSETRIWNICHTWECSWNPSKGGLIMSWRVFIRGTWLRPRSRRRITKLIISRMKSRRRLLMGSQGILRGTVWGLGIRSRRLSSTILRWRSWMPFWRKNIDMSQRITKPSRNKWLPSENASTSD